MSPHGSARTTHFRYLPVSQADIDWGMYVTTVGYSVIPPHSPYPPGQHPRLYEFSWENGRTLDEYQLVYVPEGRGVFESGPTGRVSIKGGMAFVLFPEVWHRYKPLQSTGWHEYWVGLKGDVIDRLVRKGFVDPSRAVIDCGYDEELIDVFLRMCRDAEQQPIGHRHVMSSMALQVIAGVLADAKSNRAGSSRAESIVQRTKAMMMNQLEGDLNLAAIATELNISYTHLRRLFRYHTNLAPHQYHLQLRVLRAKELLRSTDSSIKAIASTLGFDNQYYFSRIFRKKTGQSPSQWRQASR